MIQKMEIVLVLVAIVLLTLFSASFADPSTDNSPYDRENAFYGRDILKESSDSESFSDDLSADYDPYFWGVPDFSHQ
ncbi:hypothetical protein [Fusibacter sp. 3D3]|uniref:hypothetical protein n=1 Tax=Fusibacter sp. 3D3 TaxID=1048380 RepID=UPI000852A11A|nr:hypothetical protein [Fusibacter sp. 3D3]GAU76785.1 hypothetical protein F3D3_1383 [Fusibacter sp. 3D3]